jgi:hypothetical protein
VTTVQRRVCVLCGRLFPLVVPSDESESARDRLCAECATLPAGLEGPSVGL